MLCIFAAVGQSKSGDVQGYVKDIGNKPVSAASVYLLNYADSAIVKVNVTDKAGLFVFSGVKSGTYLIKVTATGFITELSGKISFNGVLNPDLGTIQLKTATTNLHGVTITGTKSFIDVRPDKTILNIRGSNLVIGNNVLEVLAKLPGVQLDNNDNISLHGRSDVLVMIDNKPTYLSGTALNDMLRGMQSSSVDKIELVTNPNSTYDAGGSGGVINIKLIRDKNTGLNVQVNGGLGWSEFPGGQYSGGKGNTGLNFNYRDKRLNIFGGYSYSNVLAYKSIYTSHADIYLGKNDVIDADQFINQRRQSNNIRLGADYSITPKQTLGFAVSEVITDLDGPKNTASQVSDNTGIDSAIITNSNLQRDQKNLSYNLNYQANFSNNGLLTLNADHIQVNRQYEENFLSTYYKPTSTTPYRSLTLQNTAPLNYNVNVFSGNYHCDINNDNNLTLGFKVAATTIDNTSKFGSVSGTTYTPYANLTGEFNYSEMIDAGYFDYNHMFNKRTSIELGARLEHSATESITSGTPVEDYVNNYWGFFPSVKLNHTINGDNQIQLSYGRRINRPQFFELNTIVLYTDQYTYQIGNQYLKPSYSNLLEFKHIYKDKFVSTFAFEAVSGFSQTVYTQSDLTQVSILKKMNLGNRYNYISDFLMPFTISNWYGIDFSANFKYQQFTGNSSQGDLDNGSADITFVLTQHFKLPLSIQADLSAYYEAPTTFGIYRYKAQYFAYGALSKSVFNKKGAIHLNVDAMFNSDKNVLTSHYQNLNLSATQINNFRTITLSFSYALGSQTIKAARKKSNDADEEQSRINGGSN